MILGDLPEDLPGEVKPELMQSVLEVATRPCQDITEAADQLRQLRRCVREVAARNGLAIGAAGTHPSAHYEDQLIVDHPRYRELAAELRWIAEQELIFGTHVHVGIDDAEKAIYVADGMRGYLPLLLGMSSNSPLWQGKTTGMMSSRTPVFRAFPRVGIPPYYGTWEIYSHRVEQMMRGGAIDGLHLPVVGRAAAPQPRHRRAARLRPADEGRAHDRLRRVRPGAGPPPRAWSTRTPCRASSTPTS